MCYDCVVLGSVDGTDEYGMEPGGRTPGAKENSSMDWLLIVEVLGPSTIKKSYHDRYRFATMCTNGDFIVLPH